jgi:hypothetical protein
MWQEFKLFCQILPEYNFSGSQRVELCNVVGSWRRTRERNRLQSTRWFLICSYQLEWDYYGVRCRGLSRGAVVSHRFQSSGSGHLLLCRFGCRRMYSCPLLHLFFAVYFIHQTKLWRWLTPIIGRTLRWHDNIILGFLAVNLPLSRSFVAFDTAWC